MKVFVTGSGGYIGAPLVDLLKDAGHSVTGCDLGIFEDCQWETPVRPDRVLVKDIRDVTRRDLDGHDCVMHLAAISNDPMGELDPELTSNVNCDGSIALARAAKQAGVGRFLFSGSCSVYGQGRTLDLDETAPLNPLTAYARSKVETEQAVGELADDGFTPVFLRNATAYGHSPMLRIDLVANNLLACAAARGDIRILSDGMAWRPLVHCRDIARAFLAFLDAPRQAVSNLAVNVGANDANYRVRDLADRVAALAPSTKIVYTGQTGADPRNYRVNFDLLGRILPDFAPAYDLDRGLEDLYRKLVEHGFSAADFDGPRFVRLRTLKTRLGRLARK